MSALTKKQIKRYITEASKASDFELGFITDENTRNMMKLARDSFIDHLYTLLKLGSYEPYLERAGVVRDEKCQQ